MTDQLTAPDSNQDSKIKKSSPWRWAWMGFALAVVLWFGSSSYFLKVHQIAEVEYQMGGMEEAEYDAMIRRDVRYSMGLKILSGMLCLASLTFLVSQIDIHRPRPNK